MTPVVTSPKKTTSFAEDDGSNDAVLHDRQYTDDDIINIHKRNNKRSSFSIVTNMNGDDNSSTSKTAWIWWGFDSLYSHRKTLLLCAFAFNLAAVTCITMAAFAIGTSPHLASVGWATATTTLQDLPECRINTNKNNNNTNNATTTTASVTIHVWLGLKGYYGECQGEWSDEEMPSHYSSVTNSHNDTFCGGGMTNISDLLNGEEGDNLLVEGEQSTPTTSGAHYGQCRRHELSCELLTDAYAIMATTSTTEQSDSSTHGGDDNEDSIVIQPPSRVHPSCTACKDTSRNCVSTLLSAATFGVFPLILTIRRYFSTKREQGLRLRTLFFSSIAIILGLHSFMRFHWECVLSGMPSAFSVLVCSEACNGGQPFLVSVPIDLHLFTGGKLVIVAAALKLCYFLLHLVTPVSKTYNTVEDVVEVPLPDDDQQQQKQRPQHEEYRDLVPHRKL